MQRDLLVFHLDYLYKNSKPVFSSGIVQGETGLALCYFYLFKITNQTDYYEKMHSILDHSIERVKDDYSLGYGLAGLCWVIEIMKNEIEGADEWLREANKVVSGKTVILLQQGNLDLFKGGLGLLFYLLTQKDTKENLSLLKDFLKIIDQKIEKNDWKVKSFRENKWITEINLGVPHGITGILLFLLLIKEKNILSVDAQILKLAELLLNYRNEDSRKCYFPAKILEENEWIDSGIGWCYGDLTIAYALLKTGILCRINEYKDISLKILRETVDREDYFHDIMILCHGYVSNAIIYDKIHKLSGDPFFQKTANKWRIATRQLCKRQYKSFLDRKEYSDFFNDSSLFYGFPGLFLAELFWDNEIDTKWSDCLLL